MAGISTTQVANHLYDLTEGWNLPRFDKCDPYRPHVTQQGAAVYKATWRDGLKAGRYDKKYLDNRRAKLSPEEWNWWYECEWPTRGEEQAFGPDLIRQLVD